MYNKIITIILILISSFNFAQNKYNPTSIELNNKSVEIIKEISLDTQSSKKQIKRKYKKVLNLLDESIKLDSTYYLAYSNKVTALLALKRNIQAIEVLKLQLIHKPDLAESHFFLGMLLDNEGDTINANISYKIAISIFEERISQSKMVEANELNLATAYKFIGENEKANEIFERLSNNEKYEETVNLIYKSEKREILKQLLQKK